jgi:hypothetical protein
MRGIAGRMDAMEPRPPSEAVDDARCRLCGAPLTSKIHVHDCLGDRVDATRYAELFWEEA